MLIEYEVCFANTDPVKNVIEALYDLAGLVRYYDSLLFALTSTSTHMPAALSLTFGLIPLCTLLVIHESCPLYHQVRVVEATA